MPYTEMLFQKQKNTYNHEPYAQLVETSYIGDFENFVFKEEERKKIHGSDNISSQTFYL